MGLCCFGFGCLATILGMVGSVSVVGHSPTLLSVIAFDCAVLLVPTKLGLVCFVMMLWHPYPPSFIDILFS